MSDSSPASASTPQPDSPAELRAGQFSLRRFLLIFAILALGFGFIRFLIVSKSRAGTRDPAELELDLCQSRLRQIGLALAAYHQRWDSYPPAVTRDPRGRPLHSWRVLIWPYLADAGNGPAEYDWTQPWNSRQNQVATRQMPEAFRCPTGQLPPRQTSYLAITGPGTLFPPRGIGRQRRRPLPAEAGLMLLEIPERAVDWTEPVDLTAAELLPSSPAPGRGRIIWAPRSTHGPGMAALFTNLEPAAIPFEALTPELLRARHRPAAGSIPVSYSEPPASAAGSRP